MRRTSYFTVCSAFAIEALSPGTCTAGSVQAPVFERALVMSVEEPVKLSVAVSGGNVDISYRRDDQLTVYASGKDASGKDLPEEYFRNNLVIEQKGNRVSIRDSLGVPSLFGSLASIDYRIDVPYRTEVDSIVAGTGNQSLAGVYGPATLITGTGDIDARYVRFAPLYARTGKGNISCARTFQADVETEAGNITLQEDGNSKAVVKRGHGRIEVGGARGTVDASIDAGTLHIKAVLWDDWQLKSGSGSIRVELPKKSSFEFNASSDSGEIDVERDDMQTPEGEVHSLHQEVNGGGKHITARSIKGSVSIE